MSTYNVSVIKFRSKEMNQIPRNYLNLKKCCIECIPNFTYSDYLYLNDVNEARKIHHQIFINKNDPNMNIMTTIIIFEI